MHPINVARGVALAKASLQVGSLAAGVWLGFLLWVFPQRGTVTAAAADSPGAVVGLLAGSTLVAAALWLEYCCRAPEDPHDDPATTLQLANGITATFGGPTSRFRLPWP